MLSTWMLLAAASAVSTTDNAADAWHADYGVALAETKEESQPLLVVLDAPGDESQRLNPDLLSAETGGFPLDSYALCHVDVATEYGKRVAEGFRVSEFPHVAIIDRSGSVILRRVSGDITPQQWREVLNRHADGARVGATRYTVAKPVVAEGATVQPAAFAEPVISSPAFATPSYPAARPYCPSCQLRNR